MNFSEAFQFIEVCPDVHVRGGIVRYPGEYRVRVQKILSGSAGTVYRSLFLHDKNFPAHYEREKKVAGYTGVYWAHEMLIDLDDNDDVGHALVSAQNIVRKLNREYLVEPDVIRVGFTGNRGFHLSLPQSLVGFAPSPHLPRQMAQFWREISSGALHPTTKFDDKIYKGTGLIRVAGSYHKAAGRYKIMLTAQELLSLDGVTQLLDMATTRRAAPVYNNNPLRHEVLAELWHMAAEPETSNSGAKPRNSSQVHAARGRHRAVSRPGPQPGVRELMRMDLHEGEGRNDAAYRITGYHSSRGIPDEIVEWMMMTWNRSLSEPLADGELIRTVRSALSRKSMSPGAPNSTRRVPVDRWI